MTADLRKLTARLMASGGRNAELRKRMRIEMELGYLPLDLYENAIALLDACLDARAEEILAAGQAKRQIPTQIRAQVRRLAQQSERPKQKRKRKRQTVTADAD
jgi:hypothetical protein